MLNKLIFKLGYAIKHPGVLECYDNFWEAQWHSYETLKARQEEQLRRFINYAYRDVPYYTKMFANLKLNPTDIACIEDLQKLPILTKKMIRANAQDFIPRNINTIKYFRNHTGGSTGEPLRYNLANADSERGVALLYRGWGYGGYQLGDPVAMIGGSSLIPSTSATLYLKAQSFIMNCRSYSSFEMSLPRLMQYFEDMNRWNPLYIRGYASSIYLFARFIKDNNLKMGGGIKAVFTTAEKLFQHQRTLIEEVLRAKVFDNYGLNDGGISAYECEKHNGLHIDTERAILECVDAQSNQIMEKSGRILATSLHNYAQPFIRYETGDIGRISGQACACGRKTPMLADIEGRVTDALILNGVIIGSPVLTILMGKFDIVQYQVVQENANSIICRIVKGPAYAKDAEKFIGESFRSHVGVINIQFDYVTDIATTAAGKYKFIINNAI